MEDQIALKPNGHVAITFDGVTYDCRRPNAKEYLSMSELAVGMAEQLKNEDENASQVEQTRKVFDVMANWFTTLLSTLCAEPQFTGQNDELPTWILGGDTIKSIMEHWVTVPLVVLGT